MTVGFMQDEREKTRLFKNILGVFFPKKENLLLGS